ncbi:MAG: ribonuclease H-like domain-containing protein [Nannocystaceae bacterium]
MNTPRRDPLAVASLAEIQPDPELLFTAFAAILSITEGRTRAGKPFFDLRLGDRSRTLAAKIWDEAGEAMRIAAELRAGDACKVLARCELYQGAPQLNIRRLRRVDEDETGYAPEAVYGEGHALIRDRLCRTLVFDIETAPAFARDALPPAVADAVDRFSARDGGDDSLVMSLSPMLGRVVSLAFADGEVDPEQQDVTVLAVPPPNHPDQETPPWLRLMEEAELLRAFWGLCAHADVVVSYNGRGFDVPFLIGRSLVHGVACRVDLMGSPYSLRPHLDLYRVITGGGRAPGPTGLDVVCWSLGIPSPKGSMDGSKVADAYAAGEILAIAEYNRGDIRATTAVYQRIRDQILQFRQEW